MKIMLCANRRCGYEVLKWLNEQGEDVAIVVLAPRHKRHDAASIWWQAMHQGTKTVVLEWDKDVSQIIQVMDEIKPDILISATFPRLFPEEMFCHPPRGSINLHPSYLPYNRGVCPNIFPFFDHSPAGGTIHYIDSGIDTGDIIAQDKFDITSIDTGQTVHEKSQDILIDLFKENWDSIKAGTSARVPQDESLATFHTMEDVRKLEYIDYDNFFSAHFPMMQIRANTFPPYPSAWFVDEVGRRINVRVQLKYAEDD